MTYTTFIQLSAVDITINHLGRLCEHQSLSVTTLSKCSLSGIYPKQPPIFETSFTGSLPLIILPLPEAKITGTAAASRHFPQYELDSVVPTGHSGGRKFPPGHRRS